VSGDAMLVDFLSNDSVTQDIGQPAEVNPPLLTLQSDNETEPVYGKEEVENVLLANSEEDLTNLANNPVIQELKENPELLFKAVSSALDNNAVGEELLKEFLLGNKNFIESKAQALGLEGDYLVTVSKSVLSDCNIALNVLEDHQVRAQLEQITADDNENAYQALKRESLCNLNLVKHLKELELIKPIKEELISIRPASTFRIVKMTMAEKNDIFKKDVRDKIREILGLTAEKREALNTLYQNLGGFSFKDIIQMDGGLTLFAGSVNLNIPVSDVVGLLGGDPGNLSTTSVSSVANGETSSLPMSGLSVSELAERQAQLENAFRLIRQEILEEILKSIENLKYIE
jgi:hypothetical protein